MKKAYDAASAFTTITSNTLDKSVPYKDFEEMNQDMLNQVNLTIKENPTGDGDKSSSDNRCGARQSGALSNAVNLILRLFLYHFLHTLSL
jgi:hypothetical protein